MPIHRRRLLTALVLTPLGGVLHAADAGPFRTIRDAHSDRLMLEGYDAVAYFSNKDALRGDPALQIEHAGVHWRFTSAQNQQTFVQAPEKYMPQYGGYCSNGVNYAIPGGGGGGPNTWRIYRGKLYVFGGQKARDHFEMDTELNLQRANQYWASDIAGANPSSVRMKRMIFRVPHYKSDAALQAEWEARLAAGTLPVMPGARQVVPEAP